MAQENSYGVLKHTNSYRFIIRPYIATRIHYGCVWVEEFDLMERFRQRISNENDLLVWIRNFLCEPL